MGSKSEARAARKALAEEARKAKQARFIANVRENTAPRVAEEPDVLTRPRMAPHLLRELNAAINRPKVVEEGSRYAEFVTWCQKRADLEGSWTWGEDRLWGEAEWQQTIAPAFQEFARLTWGEVAALSSESGHRMHHGHEIADLDQEAQSRWRELDLAEFDSVFRFRLGGTRRMWGYIVQAHFHMVWWDRYHKIYPTE